MCSSLLVTGKECLTLSADLKLNILCFTWSFDPAGLQQSHPRVKIKTCFFPNSHEVGVRIWEPCLEKFCKKSQVSSVCVLIRNSKEAVKSLFTLSLQLYWAQPVRLYHCVRIAILKLFCNGIRFAAFLGHSSPGWIRVQCLAQGHARLQWEAGQESSFISCGGQHLGKAIFRPFLFTKLCELLADPVLALWVLQALLYSIEQQWLHSPLHSSISGSGKAGILTGLSQRPAVWH